MDRQYCRKTPVQCYAYTPCTLLFVVPPGCRIDEACTPASHLRAHSVLSFHTDQNDDPPPPTQAEETDASPTTPLGSNPLALQSASPVAPNFEGPSKSPPQGAKPLRPTLSWSAGLPDVEGTRKTAPGNRRAGDKVAVKSTNTGPGNSIEKDSAQRHRVQAKEQKQAVDTQRYDCNMLTPFFCKMHQFSIKLLEVSQCLLVEAGANEGVLSKSALLSGEVETVLAIGADQLMAPAAQSVVLPKVLTKTKLAPAKGRSTSDRKRSSGNRTIVSAAVSTLSRSLEPKPQSPSGSASDLERTKTTVCNLSCF